MRPVLVIENWQDRGGDIVGLLQAAGHAVTMVRPYAGETLPAPGGFQAVVVSGGPMSFDDRRQPDYAFLQVVTRYVERLVARSVPCLGICLGHQILAAILGGRVATMRVPDVGIRSIRALDGGFAAEIRCFRSFVFHRDHVTDLPQECVATFTSKGCAVEGFRHRGLAVHGLQFHPEVSSTRAVEVLRSWRSTAEERVVVGDPLSFDGRAAASVFAVVLADLLDVAGAK